MCGGRVCTLLHPNDPAQGRGTHSDDCRHRLRSAGILSRSAPADLEREGRVSTAPCRSTLRGSLEEGRAGSGIQKRERDYAMSSHG